jgi:hypothetical protein
MTKVRQFLETMLSQKGDPYIFGAEARWSDPDPDAFDCSELVEWAGRRVGISPPIPDGAFNQWMQAKRLGLLLPVKDALWIPGTLLYVGDGTGSGRDAITHVVGNLGNGYTIEARGSKWGVGTWSVHRNFTFASKLPGIDYRNPTVPEKAQVRQALHLGDEGPDVKFAQGLFNIIIPAIAPYGYTNGEDLKPDGVWGPATASVNKSFERFWNEKGGGKLQVDDVWTMAGTAHAVSDFLNFLNGLK